MLVISGPSDKLGRKKEEGGRRKEEGGFSSRRPSLIGAFVVSKALPHGLKRLSASKGGQIILQAVATNAKNNVLNARRASKRKKRAMGLTFHVVLVWLYFEFSAAARS